MISEKLIRCGFIEDENGLLLNEVFKDNGYLGKVHIDIYSEHPLVSPTAFMLLLRTIEYNATVSNDGSRIVLKKNDTYETHFMNILFSKITECYYKVSEEFFEFIFNIQNIYYRITVSN